VPRAAAQPAKMGILVSLTGVHAIFGETMLHCAQYAQKEINDRGGIEGRKLDFVIEHDQVDVVVGSISSAMRNAVGSVTTKEKRVYLYPTYYDGGYCHDGVFITGAVPNQQVE